MNVISIIFHESNYFVRTGTTEYLKKHFKHIKIVSTPGSIEELCDAIQTVKADAIITDMLCDTHPFRLNQRFIDLVNDSPHKLAIIFWGVTPFVHHYFFKNRRNKFYGLSRKISLMNMHVFFQRLCIEGRLTDLELMTNRTLERLSQREFTIIRKLMEGKTVKVIAYELSINIKTVSTHKRSALKKLNIKSLGCLFIYK